MSESIKICCEALSTILQQAGGCGVPLGISVESVSGFKEEIDGCFELFRQLQQIMLDATVGGWGVRWYKIPLGSMMRSGSETELARLEEKLKEAETHKQKQPPQHGGGGAVGGVASSSVSVLQVTIGLVAGVVLAVALKLPRRLV